MASLLDQSTTWAEFGRRHLDRRLTKALTDALGLERPTLVQSCGIPVALEGKDLLCRARTGSGKTLCYAVPLLQRLLWDIERAGSPTPLSGLVLVPTKELIAQVHAVLSSLTAFCFDVLSVEPLMSGQKYTKAELPSVLVTTPSSLVALVKHRKGAMLPLSETLKLLVLDEADLMFSFGYEEDVRALCVLLPSTYQAMLVSATLSDEVEQLKGLMLHKPVTLKLEDPRVTGKLSQFYLVCHKIDKYLILYTLLKLQLVQGKTLMFVKSIEAAYRMNIFLERFSINAAVLNAEMPHSSRQNIIQSFNQSLIELLIASDDGFGDASGNDEDDDGEAQSGEEAAQDDEHGDAEHMATTRAKRRRRQQDDAQASPTGTLVKPAKATSADGQGERRRLGGRQKPQADEHFSLTRGVDLQSVTTVINADMPATVRSYVHRVGRCARGGASGTALTLCARDEEEAMLERILRFQASAKGMGEVKPLPMQIADAERFRYRVEDMARGLTKRAVATYRARELQLEALHSEKLKEYFEEHPEDRKALQRTQRQLRERKCVSKHLRYVPSYLVPANFTVLTPVQQAVRESAEPAAGGGASCASAAGQRAQRRRVLNARRKDPLQGFAPGPGKRRRGAQFSREVMEARDARINPQTANVEELPPLSGRKLWKLRHGKRVARKVDQVGERRRLTPGQKSRKKKFGF